MSPLEVPARCVKCGRGVANPGYAGFEGGSHTNISITAQGKSCAYCGGELVFTGTFNVVDNAIEMLSGPQWSWDLVDEMKLALRRAVDEGTDPGAALGRVDARAARSFHAALLGKPESFRRKVAAFLLGGVLADYDVARDNVETVIGAMTEVLRYVAENGHLPGS